MTTLETNPRAVIGDNNPPEPTPFELSRDEIDGLFMEATNWLDGEGVKSQADADAISRLLDMLRKAKSAADERRKIEAKPFDDGKAEVQARYNPLIQEKKGKADLAMDACKKALTPWLAKLEAEKRAVAEAARKEAEEKAAAAQAAIRAANVIDLQARADAERLIEEAKKAEAAAKRAENDKAHAKGGTRAIGLRSTYTPVLTDAREAARHYWIERRPEMEAFFLELATADVRAGKKMIPGFRIDENREAV